METLDILRQRQQEGYVAGDDDGHKLFMAVDGGGMGGVVSIGALHQLNEEGLLSHVDGFAGSSAGSINSAYAMTDKTIEGRDVYVNYLPDNGFMRYTRPLNIKVGDSEGPVAMLPLPVVDMWHLLYAMRRVAPLDTRQVVNDPRELLVGLSSLKDGKPLAVSSHDLKDSPNDLLGVLSDGATLPLGLALKYYSSDRGTCVDAAVFWPTPDSIARTKNPTHVLSIASSRRPTRVGGIVQATADRVQARWCRRYSENGAIASRHAAQARDLLQRGFMGSDRIKVGSTIVERIFPEGAKLPTRQTMDKDLLSSGFEAGRLAVVRVLQTEPRVRY